MWRKNWGMEDHPIEEVVNGLASYIKLQRGWARITNQLGSQYQTGSRIFIGMVRFRNSKGNFGDKPWCQAGWCLNWFSFFKAMKSVGYGLKYLPHFWICEKLSEALGWEWFLQSQLGGWHSAALVCGEVSATRLMERSSTHEPTRINQAGSFTVLMAIYADSCISKENLQCGNSSLQEMTKDCLLLRIAFNICDSRYSVTSVLWARTYPTSGLVNLMDKMTWENRETTWHNPF